VLELTCNDVEMDVVAVGDLAVLRAVTDAITINIPLTIAAVAILVEELIPFVQAAAA